MEKIIKDNKVFIDHLVILDGIEYMHNDNGPASYSKLGNFECYKLHPEITKFPYYVSYDSNVEILEIHGYGQKLYFSLKIEKCNFIKIFNLYSENKELFDKTLKKLMLLT